MVFWNILSMVFLEHPIIVLNVVLCKLNSNEAFNPGEGFQVDVVFVKTPQCGSGTVWTV